MFIYLHFLFILMKILKEKEAEDFLAKKGFAVARRDEFYDKEDAFKFAHKIGFPVVLKVTGVLHKTDIGGVMIVDKYAFYNKFNELKKKSSKILVQEYVKGKEIILGLKNDDTFGYSVMFGLGGVFVEVFDDVSFRVCPISKKDALEMIKEIKAYKVLKGIRGDKSINFSLLVKNILRLNKLTKSGIRELDINPLIINQKEAKIVDARIILD